MDIMNDTPSERSYQFPSPSAPSVGSYNSNYATPAMATAVAGYSSYTQYYSSALSESLAETPGVSITPLEYDNNIAASYYGGNPHSGGATAGQNCKLEVSEETILVLCSLCPVVLLLTICAQTQTQICDLLLLLCLSSY